MAFTRQELLAGFRVGDCIIEPRQNRIVRGDSEVHLEPRVVDVLVCLAERAGEVVSRETLNEQEILQVTGLPPAPPLDTGRLTGSNRSAAR